MGMVMVDSFSIRRSPINENKLCGPKASDFLLKKTYYITLNILYSYRLQHLSSHPTYVPVHTYIILWILYKNKPMYIDSLFVKIKTNNVDIQVLSY